MRYRRLTGAAVCLAVLTAAVGASCRLPRLFRFLSWDDYVSERKPGSYALELTTSRGALLFFGVTHTYDPGNRQISEIQGQWAAFRPDLALVEGVVWPVLPDLNASVRTHGEGGLLRYLANRDDVPIETLEASERQQIDYLRRYYPDEWIKIYFVLLFTTIERRRLQDGVGKDYIDSILLNFCTRNGCFGPPYTLADFEARLRQSTLRLRSWQTVPDEFFYDLSPGNFVASIHRDFNDFRNQIMAAKIVDAMSKGRRVFALAGKSHVVMQEPALRIAAGTDLVDLEVWVGGRSIRRGD